MNEKTRNKIKSLSPEGKKPRKDGWRGYTLEELRYKRAMSVIELEIEKEKMSQFVSSTKERTSQYGIRGLFGNKKILSRLKFADYVFLGTKLTGFLYRRWRNKRR